jgi:hypothetical protein
VIADLGEQTIVVRGAPRGDPRPRRECHVRDQQMEEQIRRKAEQVFQEAERAQQSERRVMDEKHRQDEVHAKTKRLREMRLAKEAAEAARGKAG